MSSPIAPIVDCIRILIGDDISEEGEVPDFTDDQLIKSVTCALTTELYEMGVSYNSDDECLESDDTISAEQLALITLYSAKTRLTGKTLCNFRSRAISFTENATVLRDQITYICLRISKIEAGVAVGAVPAFEAFARECRYRWSEYCREPVGDVCCD